MGNRYLLSEVELGIINGLAKLNQNEEIVKIINVVLTRCFVCHSSKHLETDILVAKRAIQETAKIFEEHQKCYLN